MQVFIESIQDKVEAGPHIEEIIKSAVRLCLENEKFEHDSEISILLVDNERIAKINKEHMGIDKPTDVLSFPMVDMCRGKVLDRTGDYDMENQLLVLGDIVISLEKAKEQAEEYGHSFEREIAFLVTHGVYHLLGYDHEDPEQENEMMSRQEDVLTKMNLKRKQDGK